MLAGSSRALPGTVDRASRDQLKYELTECDPVSIFPGTGDGLSAMGEEEAHSSRQAEANRTD